MCNVVKLSIFLIIVLPGPVLACHLEGASNGHQPARDSKYLGAATEPSRIGRLPTRFDDGRRFDNKFMPTPEHENKIPGDDNGLGGKLGPRPAAVPPDVTGSVPPGIGPSDGPDDGANREANRFSTRSTTAVPRRTQPYRASLKEECDYLAYYCLLAYKTGKVCGRTLYYNYQDFENYCMLDYVNCMERYEVWQIVHMGECFEVKVITDYQLYVPLLVMLTVSAMSVIFLYCKNQMNRKKGYMSVNEKPSCKEDP